MKRRIIVVEGGRPVHPEDEVPAEVLQAMEASREEHGLRACTAWSTQDLSARQVEDVIQESCHQGLARELAEVAVPAVLRALAKLGLMEGEP